MLSLFDLAYREASASIDCQKVNRLIKKCSKYQQIEHRNVEKISEVFVDELEGKKCLAVVGEAKWCDLHEFIENE